MALGGTARDVDPEVIEPLFGVSSSIRQQPIADEVEGSSGELLANSVGIQQPGFGAANGPIGGGGIGLGLGQQIAPVGGMSQAPLAVEPGIRAQQPIDPGGAILNPDGTVSHGQFANFGPLANIAGGANPRQSFPFAGFEPGGPDPSGLLGRDRTFGQLISESGIQDRLGPGQFSEGGRLNPLGKALGFGKDLAAQLPGLGFLGKIPTGLGDLPGLIGGLIPGGGGVGGPIGNIIGGSGIPGLGPGTAFGAVLHSIMNPPRTPDDALLNAGSVFGRLFKDRPGTIGGTPGGKGPDLAGLSEQALGNLPFLLRGALGNVHPALAATLLLNLGTTFSPVMGRDQNEDLSAQGTLRNINFTPEEAAQLARGDVASAQMLRQTRRLQERRDERQTK